MPFLPPSRCVVDGKGTLGRKAEHSKAARMKPE